MENSKTARLFLRMNAIFSLVVGADLLLAPSYAADILFIELAGWQAITLRVLGVGLIVFGLDLLLMARDRFLSKEQVVLITTMDVGWILGSIALLLFYSQLFTSAGTTAIAIVAGFVVIFAVGQYVGAQGIKPPLSQASVKVIDGKTQCECYIFGKK